MVTVLRDFCGLQKSKQTSDREGSDVCVIYAGFAEITTIVCSSNSTVLIKNSAS